MEQALESTVEKLRPVPLEVAGASLLLSLLYSTADAEVPVAVTIQRHADQYPRSTWYLWRSSGQINWDSAETALAYAEEQARSLISVLDI